MAKNIHVGAVAIPLADYAVARTAILGITKSGKTYGAKGIAEQLLDADVPIVVFDAIGVWRHLKAAGAHPQPKGYPIVIAGGASADLPLTPQSAPEIVRAAIAENIPLVVDLYDAKLSKADWRRIVQASFRTLLYENKGPRHIFLEEAAEYAPQAVRDGETYAEVEKLARMGGNVGLGITIINQRAQEVNKAVLELCDNLVLLRQRGSHAITALEKWLDRASPEIAKEIARSLPHMSAGECWVWTEEKELPVRTRTVQLRSLHPDRRVAAPATSASKVVDTGQFVARLSGRLAELVERAKGEDPKALRKRIAMLERELELKQKEIASLAALSTPEQPAMTPRDMERLLKAVDRTELLLEKFAERVSREISPIVRTVTGLGAKLREAPAPPRVSVTSEPTVRIPPVVTNGHDALGNERRILTTAAMLDHRGLPVTVVTIARWLGLHPNGGRFRASLQALKKSGYLTEDLRLTEAGAKIAPPPETGFAGFLGSLKDGQQRRIAEAIHNKGGFGSIQELADSLGLHPNGGRFRGALGWLRQMAAIADSGRIEFREGIYR